MLGRSMLERCTLVTTSVDALKESRDCPACFHMFMTTIIGSGERMGNALAFSKKQTEQAAEPSSNITPQLDTTLESTPKVEAHKHFRVKLLTKSPSKLLAKLASKSPLKNANLPTKPAPDTVAEPPAPFLTPVPTPDVTPEVQKSKRRVMIFRRKPTVANDARTALERNEKKITLRKASKVSNGDTETAIERKQNKVTVRKASKADGVGDLMTATEKQAAAKKPSKSPTKLKVADNVKTAEESPANDKLRRLVSQYRKKGGSISTDSTRTAREKRGKQNVKIRKVNNEQDSMKTAKERHAKPEKAQDGTKSPNGPNEDNTQEQDAPLPIEKLDNDKAQSEAKAWVERMLEKGVRGLRQEFFRLRAATNPTADKYQQFTINAAFGRNRYRDVFCLDGSRIVLKNNPNGNDYIHANYVATPLMPNRFICAQAPKDETIYDFWLMILQEKVEEIVMLGDFIEKTRPKCSQYFPEEVNVTFVVNDINVECTQKSILSQFACKMIKRRLKATKEGVTHEVTHFHWSSWPDHGVPNADYSPFRLLGLIKSTKQPICVHCSAGIGRTGSLVVIEYLLERLRVNGGCDDLVNIVKEMRTQRAGIVQTELQYLYVHRVMLMYFKELKLISDSDKLQNFINDYEKLIPPFQ